MQICRNLFRWFQLLETVCLLPMMDFPAPTSLSPNSSTPPHPYLDVYKVASKIIGLTQFWAAGIPLYVRHKNKPPHPLIYPGGRWGQSKTFLSQCICRRRGQKFMKFNLKKNQKANFYKILLDTAKIVTIKMHYSCQSGFSILISAFISL